VQAYVELGRTEVDDTRERKEDSRYEKASETAASERNTMKPKLGS